MNPTLKAIIRGAVSVVAAVPIVVRAVSAVEKTSQLLRSVTSSLSARAPGPIYSSCVSDGRQARGLRFLRWTANRAYDHKNMVRTPDFKDRLGAASAAKKAQMNEKDWRTIGAETDGGRQFAALSPLSRV